MHAYAPMFTMCVHPFNAPSEACRVGVQARRQAHPLDTARQADGIRLAANRLALGLCRHPQRQRALLLHRRLPTG